MSDTFSCCARWPRLPTVYPLTATARPCGGWSSVQKLLILAVRWTSTVFPAHRAQDESSPTTDGGRRAASGYRHGELRRGGARLVLHVSRFFSIAHAATGVRHHQRLAGVLYAGTRGGAPSWGRPPRRAAPATAASQRRCLFPRGSPRAAAAPREAAPRSLVRIFPPLSLTVRLASSRPPNPRRASLCSPSAPCAPKTRRTVRRPPSSHITWCVLTFPKHPIFPHFFP